MAEPTLEKIVAPSQIVGKKFTVLKIADLFQQIVGNSDNCIRYGYRLSEETNSILQSARGGGLRPDQIPYVMGGSGVYEFSCFLKSGDTELEAEEDTEQRHIMHLLCFKYNSKSKEGTCTSYVSKEVVVEPVEMIENPCV